MKLAELTEAIDTIGRFVAEFDPAFYEGQQARALIEEFARAERLAGAGKALAATRVDATGVYRESMYRSAAHLLAKVSGSTVFAAEQAIKSAHQIQALPETEAAWRAGELSLNQVALVTEAATADTTAEPMLLKSSKTDGVKGLKATANLVLAAAARDANETYARITRERTLRHWRDLDGAGQIHVRGPFELTSQVMTTLRAYEEELYQAARDRKEEVPAEALMFDALVAMADAAHDAPLSPAKAHDVTMMIRVDARSLETGTLEPGEVCEIVGGGPIPVSVAQRFADDAFLKVLLTDAVDVHAISHYGRTINAALRSALDELFPECAYEGCNQAWGLEIDHNWDLILGGPTALWNLNKLCRYHHQEKHRRNLRLVGEGTHKYFIPAAEWTPPERIPRPAPLAAV